MTLRKKESTLSDGFNEASTASIHAYHIHIYYKTGAASERKAKTLARIIAQRFPSDVEEVKEYDVPGGPHAVSNVAVHITPQGFSRILPWLQVNTQDLPILVHPKAGDVVKDHIDYGLWLGKRRNGLLNKDYFSRKRAERQAKP